MAPPPSRPGHPRSLARRAFLRSAAAAAAAAAFPLVYARRAAAAASPYGPLRPDPRGILDLPEGFRYRILEAAMHRMDDGYRVPGRPDGMGCFPLPGGRLALLRNHENYPDQRNLGPYHPGQAPPPEAFDPASMGAVTRLVIRADTFERVSSNLVLCGTNRNCAGGLSPFGWLSCEENVAPGHGYVFACPPDADRVRPPQRIPAYGRFHHEAATVDPDTRIAYLTEDRDDGCFYRFVPDRPDTPFQGRLQALRAVARDRLETTRSMAVGAPIEVAWVDLEDADPKEDTLRKEARRRGAALFCRGEGITRFRDAVYLCATSGGPADSGQIFRYTPAQPGRPHTLELVAQSTDRDALDRPDNITFSPWGELFMAEDGPGETYLVVLDARGQTYPIARNALSNSEMAGVCFSPDGRALFVNIQEDGLTLAITGPFPKPPDAAAPAPGSENEAPFIPGDKNIALPVSAASSVGCGRWGAGSGGAAAIAGVAALGWLSRRVSSRS